MAKEISREEDTKSEVMILQKPYFSNKKAKDMLKYVTLVWTSLEKVGWWKNLQEWSKATAILLEYTKFILQQQGLELDKI